MAPEQRQDSVAARLSPNAREVLKRRYVRRGPDGKPAETVEGMFRRVAHHVAAVETAWKGDVQATEELFYDLLTSFRFVPNSPTFTGAGTPLGQLAACFHPDQPIVTADGVKAIRDVEAGDLVLTHTGVFSTVLETMSRYSTELLEISVSKLPKPTLRITPEHPVLALRKEDVGTEACPEWIPAGQLRVGDYVALAIPTGVHDVAEIDLMDLLDPERYEAQDGLVYQKNRVLTFSGYVKKDGSRSLKRRSDVGPLSRQVRPVKRRIGVDGDLLRLFGYYVAEGCASPRDNTVRFTFSKDETLYVEDVRRIMAEKFGMEAEPELAGDGRHWISLRYHSAILAEVFHTLFGSTFDSKIVPSWILELPYEKQEAFLAGIIRGDSTTFLSKNTCQTRIVMSNPSLVYGAWQIARRLGINAALGKASMPSLATAQPYSCTLSGLKASELVSDVLGRPIPHTGHEWSRTIVQGGYALNPITAVSPLEFEGLVYNLEVENDHSYVANMVAVHNCFVLPISDDMGRRDDGIFQTLRNMALIHQTGGGTGFSFSRLRPREAAVISSGGKATGPVGFMRVYDLACEIVSQGGTRRGANMGVLRVDHPDIEEFITCKTDEHAITNFNISVGITDAFMRAVENDAEWELRFPDVLQPAYRTFNGTLEEAEQAGIPIQVYKRVRARELFDQIVRQAHRNGEPGLLFLDAMNRSNPCPHLGAYEATNPCIAGDTWVVTDQGPVQVEQIVGRPISILVNGRFYPTSGEGFFCTGERETLEIRTRRGFCLTVTPEHLLRVVTRMTRYTLESEWRQAGDLKTGDRVLLGEHRDAAWGGRGTWEEGYLLGLLVGDGTLTGGRGIIAVWGDRPGPEAVRRKVEKVVAALPHRADFGGFTSIPERKEYRLRLKSLYDLARTYGLSEDFKGISPQIEQTSSDFHAGFLQGLFDADGTVVGDRTKGLSVRLAQSDLSLLKAVQRMLHRLGIVATLYENRRNGTSRLPDGRGGRKDYRIRPQHELVISRENVLWFARRVGFTDEEKAARLRQGLAAYQRRMGRERFIDDIVAIEPRGRARVYDARVTGVHAFDANGFYVHNCGEQPLLPYENCCLGSIHLARHVGQSEGRACIDWDLLQKTVEQAVRFLDNVVDANAYVPAIPQLKEAAHRTRRIGLGIMALGDVMYMLGVRYGSEEAQELAAQIMEFIRYHAMRASVDLARERGPFPAIRGSIYDPHDLRWTPPSPLVPYTRLEKWGRPPLDWTEILEGIRKYGLRNAAQLTIAPTGTIATIAGCEAYGCEPVYALAYTRRVHDDGREIELRTVSPLFMQALEQAGIDEPTRERILQQVLFTGSCQNVPEVPPEIRRVFVVAGDIPAEEHVRMQAALQAFVDAAISKTINFPAGAPLEEVARAYMLAWKLGCKGLTVYVTGSRERVVLETEAVRKARAGDPAGPPPGASVGTAPMAPPLAPVRPRPHLLEGRTYRIHTPLGTAYVTVNCNGEGEPFEVFLNVGKAGSDTAAVAEAIGRLISLVLRVPSPLPARRRLQQVVKQLRGIGGGRPTGFGRDRVQSLPDGVAQVLAEFLGLEVPPEQETATIQLPLFPLGDLCPDCGHAALVSEEGCRRCYTCGYSEC